MKSISLLEIRKRALLAADWYVNSQVPVNRPRWDANAGRFIYTYRPASRFRVHGLGWTQARGVMVLMAAYRLTGAKKYMETAIRAVDYVKALQVLDRASPYYGAMCEEIPQSTYGWPRDGAEAASAFLHLYNETGDKDLLRRAKLYGDWLLSVTHPKTGFPPIYFYFSPVRKQYIDKAFMAGCGMLYSLLYRATGERRYLEKGLKPLAQAIGRRFLDTDGALVDGHFDAHHSGKDGADRTLVLNDDGLCAALLAYANITRKEEHVREAVRIADWMMTLKPVPVFSSLPGQLCFIMDIFRQTGHSKYRDYVLKRLPEILKLQVKESKDPWQKGGFRGEDELTEWYDGGKGSEYITNRVTAYSALCLFKLAGKDWAAGYSAFGWKRKPVKV